MIVKAAGGNNKFIIIIAIIPSCIAQGTLFFTSLFNLLSLADKAVHKETLAHKNVCGLGI